MHGTGARAREVAARDCLSRACTTRAPSPESRAPPCTSNSTPPPPSASCGPPPCPSRSSSARRMLGYPGRGAARPRRRLRRSALPQGRERRRPASPIIGAELTLIGSRDSGLGARGRVGADRADQSRPERTRSGQRDSADASRAPGPEPRAPSRPPCPRLLPRGLPQPLPPHHDDEAARAQRRGRAHARGSRRPRRRAGGAGRPVAAAVRAARRGRAARSAGRHLRPRATSTWSCSGTCSATRPGTTRCWSRWPRRSACRSWPPTACASPRRPSVRCTTCSPASANTPRWRRPAGGWWPTPSAI